MAESVLMFQAAYKDPAMSKTSLNLFLHFSLGDQPRSGSLSTFRNITKINEMVWDDRHQTIDKLVNMSGVSWSSCQ